MPVFVKKRLRAVYWVMDLKATISSHPEFDLSPDGERYEFDVGGSNDVSLLRGGGAHKPIQIVHGRCYEKEVRNLPES